MSEGYTNEQILEAFIFETTQLSEQLEQLLLNNESQNDYDEATINEIFRIMHTIKGSAALMQYNNISKLAHSVEDLFYFIRENKDVEYNSSSISDLIFECIDFIKIEIEKIKNNDNVDGNCSELISEIRKALEILKSKMPDSESINKTLSNTNNSNSPISSLIINDNNLLKYKNAFKAIVYFEEGCEMENVRAFSIINKINKFTDCIYYIPENIIENENTCEIIKKDGFRLSFKTNNSYDEINSIFTNTIFLKSYSLVKLEDNIDIRSCFIEQANNHQNVIESKTNNLMQKNNENKHKDSQNSNIQNMISVNVNKLDGLMDLVGELVISEDMVTQNPDLNNLELENFKKATRQLHKITSELQDIVMSIRMVPLSTTFMKMNRITRDMSKKLEKEVELIIVGEETEVDKNIIEHISDPLMHLIRNSLDHGIESPEIRLQHNKPSKGKVVLEAKNAGGEVLIIIKDDGKGLNKEKILKKAKENGLLNKPENEMTEKEIFSLIFLPGFSTKEKVTEFSGRGVGMDVVMKNISKINGDVLIDSIENVGTTITIKIPLTLAIIDGMNIRVGNSRYTIPTISIKESFKIEDESVFSDTNGNEMIMVRGQCYPIVRFNRLFNVKSSSKKISEGIMIMVENDSKIVCLFADELLGGQQVVVKSLPNYIKKVRGLAGCTLLGDGSISLILDIAGLINMYNGS